MQGEKWLPLEQAADSIKQNLRLLRSQMRNGRIQRGRHFRLGPAGVLELNVPEYVAWKNEQRERRGLPLIQRIRLETLDRQNERAIKPVEPAPRQQSVQPAVAKRPRLIPLRVWAEDTFGEYAPGRNTLCAWAKNGRIQPIPKKVGTTYFCSPDAEYIDPREARLRRMIRG